MGAAPELPRNGNSLCIGCHHLAARPSVFVHPDSRCMVAALHGDFKGAVLFQLLGRAAYGVAATEGELILIVEEVHPCGVWRREQAMHAPYGVLYSPSVGHTWAAMQAMPAPVVFTP